MNGQRRSWSLWRRRQCLVPTWRGWLVLLLCFGALTGLVLWRIHPFLAVTAPVPAEALVVEGWAADSSLAIAVSEFKRGRYQGVYVTGGPVEHGSPLLSDYKSYAELGAAILLKMGLATNQVQAVPAPRVRQDRTYTAAVALRTWWRDHGSAPASINVMTEGTHARRSWLLFEKALGKGVSVGVMAIPDSEYDANRWWCSSAGVRSVIAESLAYGYARFLFRAPKD